MKYALPALLIIAVGLLVYRMIDKKKDVEQAPIEMTMPTGVHTVKVKEVIQTSSYTYLKVKEAGEVYWMAVTKIEASEGETYSWQTGMIMEDFESPELERVFESIYFVQDLFKGDPATGMPIPSEHNTTQPRTEMDAAISVEKAEGGMTIAELMKDKAKLAGKKVTVRGKVVKYNYMIMNRNWIHIQDGTKFNDLFDLTITSMEEVEEGDIVTFTGTVSTDKDFGAGYFYELIVEDATVIQE